MLLLLLCFKLLSYFNLVWNFIENLNMTMFFFFSPKNIIWTSEASVHILLFWWRTGPYTAIWPSVPCTVCPLFVSFPQLHRIKDKLQAENILDILQIKQVRNEIYKRTKSERKALFFRILLFIVYGPARYLHYFR
jgi:hypothetical protein